MTRRLVYLLLFVVAGFVGRATILDGRALSLVWPAAGVAVLWFLGSAPRARVADAGLLAAATFGVNLLTGASPTLSTVFVAANLVQVFLIVWLLERPLPSSPPLRYGAPLESPKPLLRLLWAASWGCLGGTMVGVAGLSLVDAPVALESTLTWFGRNAFGVVGVVATGLLLVHAWFSRGQGVRPALVWGRGAELAALVGATVALLGAELWVDGLPLVFLLPGTTVWAGMRFPAPLVAAHALVAGGGAVWLTVLGVGPFAEVSSIQLGALTAQLFVGMTVVVGLFLAMGREESARLQAGLTLSRAHALEQAELLEAVLGSLREGVVLLDAHGGVELANPAAEFLLAGRSGRAVDGLPLVALLRSAGADAQEAAALLQTLGSGGSADLAIDRPRPGVVALSGRALRRSGRPGVVVALTDVTDERIHEQELAAFASVAAHDLLNPIGVVDGWAQVIELALPPEQECAVEREAVDRIRGAAGRMQRLVHDLLDDALSRGRQLDVERVDLEQLVRQIVEERACGDEVRTSTLPVVNGDPRLLRQVLDNLIGNGLKYTAPGARADLRISSERVDDAMVRIHVSDRGVGIPHGEHERVFGQFHRAANTTEPGTGLGLAICKRIVERHGGEIVAREGSAGMGTVVSFTLPLPAVLPPAPEVA